jgi:non-ribosomal peptide synthase protein (TIGR01720 family)
MSTLQPELSQDNIQSIYELSPMQEGMYFHSEAARESHAYFQQVSFRVRGLLNPEIVRESFQFLLNRYDILRTVFIHKTTDYPVQVVLKQRIIPFQTVDLSSVFNQVEEIRKIEINDRLTGFDLAKDVLTRVLVLKLATDEFHVVWSHHHILMDGWCLNILFAEINKIYHSLLAGEPPILPEAVQYKQYIRWLKNRQNGNGLSFWGSYLEGFNSWTRIPRYREASLDSYVPRETVYLFNKELTTRIRTACSNYKVTVSNFLQTIWGLLVCTYTHNTDVVFGMVVSGRPPELDGIERMVGLFINTLPVRVRISDSDTFEKVIKELQHYSIQVEAFQNLRLSDIQGQSNLKKHLIDHVVVIANYPLEEQIVSPSNEATPSLKIAGVSGYEQTNYDLNVLIGIGENLSFRYKYNGTCFSEKQIQCLAGNLEKIAELVLQSPDVSLKDILLSGTRREDTAAPLPEKNAGAILSDHWFEKMIHPSTRFSVGGVALNVNDFKSRVHCYAEWIITSAGIQQSSLIQIRTGNKADYITLLYAVWHAGLILFSGKITSSGSTRQVYVLTDNGTEEGDNIILLPKDLPERSSPFAGNRLLHEAIRYEVESGDVQSITHQDIMDQVKYLDDFFVRSSQEPFYTSLNFCPESIVPEIVWPIYSGSALTDSLSPSQSYSFIFTDDLMNLNFLIQNKISFEALVMSRAMPVMLPESLYGQDIYYLIDGPGGIADIHRWDYILHYWQPTAPLSQQWEIVNDKGMVLAAGTPGWLVKVSANSVSRTGHIAWRMIDDCIALVGYLTETRDVLTNALMKLCIENKIYAKALVSVEWQKENRSINIVSDDLIFDWENYLLAVVPNALLPPLHVRAAKTRVASEKKGDSGKKEVASSETEKTIVAIWQEILNIEEIGVDQNFFRMAGDSLKATRIIGRMRKAGFQVSMKDFFNHPTIRSLAKYVKPVGSSKQKRDLYQEEIPLTPIQHFYFEFNQHNPHHFNQSLMFHVPEADEEGLRLIFDKIIEQHDAFRLKLCSKQGRWIQTVSRQPVLDYFVSKDYTNHPDPDTDILATANAMQRSIRLEDGLLLRVGFFKTRESNRLLIIVHHLAIDRLSWDILLDNLNTLYLQWTTQKDLNLEGESQSVAAYAFHLKQIANSKEILDQIDYWKRIEDQSSPGLMPINIVQSRLARDVRRKSFAFGEAETKKLLEEANEAFGTSLNDLVLGALVQVISKYSGTDTVILWAEGHGREEIGDSPNIDSAMGWFTTLYPLLFENNSEDISRHIIEVKEVLRRVPANGLGYGILKYLTDPNKRTLLTFKQRPLIVYNYLGQLNEAKDSAISIANGLVGDMQPEELPSETMLNIHAIVVKGRLRITIEYNRFEFDEMTIQIMMHQWTEYISVIVDHCLKHHKQLTPSDLDFKDLSTDDVENFFN